MFTFMIISMFSRNIKFNNEKKIIFKYKTMIIRF